MITFLFVIGILFIFAALVTYLALNVSMTILAVISYFVFPSGPAIFATRAIVFFRWERKHRRRILSAGEFSTKIYVFPKIDQQTISPLEK